MNRDKFFGIDAKKQWVFVFYQKIMIKNYHYLLNIRMKKIWNWQNKIQRYMEYFWDTGSTVEAIINSFDINPSKKLGLKTWYEQV